MPAPAPAATNSRRCEWGDRLGAFAQLARKCRAGQLWCSLSAERCAHPHGDDRERAANEARKQLELSAAQPQRFGDFSAARTAQPPHEQRSRAGDRPGGKQHEQISVRRGGRDRGKELARRAPPGKPLDQIEQRDERRTGKTGGRADRDDEPPEAQTVPSKDPLPRNVRLRRGEAARHRRTLLRNHRHHSRTTIFQPRLSTVFVATVMSAASNCPRHFSTIIVVNILITRSSH
jgi:hypothetical protein